MQSSPEIHKATLAVVNGVFYEGPICVINQKVYPQTECPTRCNYERSKETNHA